MQKEKGTKDRRPRQMGKTATYIYCLVERSRRPSLAKVPAGLPGAAAPELIAMSDELWAASAQIPLSMYGSGPLEEHLKDMDWVAEAAVAHESVVEYFAAATGAAVVPMKLFTMFSSRERAVADLQGRRGELLPVLDRIRGCQEWGVRVSLRAQPNPRGTAARAASGTAFLAAKRRARDDARARVLEASQSAESAFQSLAGLARESRRRTAPQGATTPPLIDAAFLVASTARTRFRAAASRWGRACRDAGADLVLTGPWPAYNFVQAHEESA
jgi:hypothetical protein